MPYAARKPCSIPGCPDLATDRGRCGRHTHRHNWSGSGSFEDRYGMSRSEWDRLKAIVLRRDSDTCTWCGGPATTADHIIPVAEGGAQRDLANLAAICTDCHTAKTAAESARGQQRKRTARRVGGSPSLAPPAGALPPVVRRTR